MPNVESRLAARIVVDPQSGCWLWTGFRLRDGYGQIKGPANKVLRVHRVAYEIAKGPIPSGLQIDHLCRVRNCVNPTHLEAVTGRVNMLRGDNLSARRAAQTHCKNGHPFDEANTYRPPGGSRECRVCKTSLRREWRAKKSA